MRAALVLLLLTGCGERAPAPPQEGASCADSFGGPGGTGYVEACTTGGKTYWCCNEGASALVCEGKDTLTWHYLKEGCEL